MANRVRWNLHDLESAAAALEREHERLTEARGSIVVQHIRVSNNWSSPAGMQYHIRVSEDMELLNKILDNLQIRIDALRSVIRYYTSAESTIDSAVSVFETSI